MRRVIGTSLVLLLGAACASIPADPEPEAAAPNPAAENKTVENVIHQADMERVGASSAYDAIVKLRGNFLSDRGATSFRRDSPRKPSIFIDGQYYGEVETLRNISVTRLSSIRLYRSYEAQQKFGNNLLGGVIDLITKQ
jgi:hypothetical protein